MPTYTLPQIEAPSLDDLEISVTPPPLSTTDDLIGRLHETLRDAAPRQQRGPDEALEMGDEVDCDIVMEFDGQIWPGGAQRLPKLEMRSILDMPGLIEAMVGMTPNSETSVELNLASDYPVPSLAGRRTTIHVKIRDAYRVEMPELDDTAALEASHLGSSVEEAMATIAGLLDGEQGEDLLVLATEAVLDAVAQRVQVEVPDEAVDEELRLGWEKGPGALLGQGFAPEQVEAARDAYQSSPAVRADAVRRIKINLALAALVEKEGLEPSVEVMRELLEAASLPLDMTLAQLKKALAAEPEEARQAVESALYLTAVRYVVAKAKITVLDDE